MTSSPHADRPCVPARHLAGVRALLADGRRTLLGVVRRHERFGRSAQGVLDRVAATGQPNARLIAATRVRAQHLSRWS